MSYLELAKKIQAGLKAEAAEPTNRAPFTPLTPKQAAEIDAGQVQAVLINSEILGAPIWFAFDDDFKSGDGIPIFYASELPFLRKMTPDELRRRYAEKKALCGGWIRDRIEH